MVQPTQGPSSPSFFSKAVAALGNWLGRTVTLLVGGINPLTSIFQRVMSVAGARVTPQERARQNLDALAKDVALATLDKLKEGASLSLDSESLGQKTSSRSMAKLDQTELGANLNQYFRGGNASVSNAEQGKFCGEVKALSEKIASLEHPTLEDIDKIRGEVDRLMGHPAYQALKNKKGALAINYLQILAVKFVSPPCQNHLSEYAEKELGLSTGVMNTDLTALATGLKDNLAEKRFPKRDSKWERVKWARQNWEQAKQSAEADLLRPLEVNLHKHNPSMQAHTFGGSKGRSFVFHYGPTPHGDKVFDGMLCMMDKMGTKYVHISHQDTNKKPAERGRLVAFEEHTKEHEDAARQPTLTHAVLSLDTTVKAVKDSVHPPITPASIDPLFENLEKLLDSKEGLEANTTGFHIGDSFLTKEQVQEALACAKKIAKEVQGPLPEKAEDFCKMMVLLLHGVLCVRGLNNALTKLNPPEWPEGMDPDLTANRISQACKQDVDRGPVENVVLSLFFRLLSNADRLNKEEFTEMAGAVLGRARLVDQGDIMDKRFTVLENLLKFIGSRQKQVAECLKELINSDSQPVKPD